MFGFVCLLVCFGRLTVLLGLFSKKLPRIKRLSYNWSTIGLQFEATAMCSTKCQGLVG